MSYQSNLRRVVFRSFERAGGKTALMSRLCTGVCPQWPSPTLISDLDILNFPTLNQKLMIQEVAVWGWGRGSGDIHNSALDVYCFAPSSRNINELCDLSIRVQTVFPRVQTVPRILVLTKCDLPSLYSDDDFSNYAERNGFCEIIKVSALTGFNIEELKQLMLSKAFSNAPLVVRPPSPPVALPPPPPLSFFARIFRLRPAQPALAAAAPRSMVPPGTGVYEDKNTRNKKDINNF